MNDSQTEQTPSTPGAQFTNLSPHYDELMEDVPYSAWAEYVSLLFEIAEAKPKTILDCACGTGNVSFELAARGYDVTGVDISETMIAAARAKESAPSTPRPSRFIQADLCRFDLGETFDAATCLYDSFNYILEPENLQAAFGCIANHIQLGGVFVFDMNAPFAFEANLFTQRSRNSRKNLRYDWRANYNHQSRICEVEMLFERQTRNGIEQFSEVHRERAYTRAEVNAMLVKSGLEVLKNYDAYTLNAPHERSERWYFLARRA